MKCPSCQTDNPVTAPFCQRCGTALGAPAAPPPMQQAPRSNTGKTVAIVIGVVLFGCIFITAILAAIMFPVFAKARSKAQISNCMSHQRQLAVGLLAAAQDNDETFPLPQNWVDATSMSADPSVWDCSASKETGTPQNPDYGMNALLIEHDSKTGKPVGVPLGMINDPTRLPLLADGGDADHLLKSETDIDKRHEDKFVASYVDGHVALVDQITFPKNYNEF